MECNLEEDDRLDGDIWRRLYQRSAGVMSM